MTVTMYDSVTVSEIPANAEAVAGYVGGRWPTYNTLVVKFPHAHKLSIAIAAPQDADCLDIEPGDADVSQAPAWWKRQVLHDPGKRPALYTSASNVGKLIETMTAAKILRTSYRVWSAHYTFKAHICGPGTCGYPQADATQWTDRSTGGVPNGRTRNLDESLCADSFFAEPKPPKPEDPYARFAKGPFYIDGRKIYERRTVREYDELMKHPRQNAARIRHLKKDLVALRKRVWAIAHRSTPPSWDKYHRGWRWQQLDKRTK